MRALLLLVPLAVLGCGGESDDDSGTGGEGGSSGATGGTGASGGSDGGSAGTSGSSASGGKGGSTGGTGGKGGTAGTAGKGATGGTESTTGGTAGDGGSAGTSGTSGSSGSAGTSGDGGSAGTGMECCLAFPACGPGEEQVESLDDCPPLATCHEVSICCSTIVCAAPAAQCNAIPVCDEGDTEVKACLEEEESCYSRSLCGTTILCRDDSCDPDSEFNRNYVALGETCLLVDFACEENTEYFFNDCGCGCEQDSSCPEYLNCMPGGDVPPECSDETACPFTPRAY